MIRLLSMLILFVSVSLLTIEASAQIKSPLLMVARMVKGRVQSNGNLARGAWRMPFYQTLYNAPIFRYRGLPHGGFLGHRQDSTAALFYQSEDLTVFHLTKYPHLRFSTFDVSRMSQKSTFINAVAEAAQRSELLIFDGHGDPLSMSLNKDYSFTWKDLKGIDLRNNVVFLAGCSTGKCCLPAAKGAGSFLPVPFQLAPNLLASTGARRVIGTSNDIRGIDLQRHLTIGSRRRISRIAALRNKNIPSILIQKEAELLRDLSTPESDLIIWERNGAF